MLRGRPACPPSFIDQSEEGFTGGLVPVFFGPPEPFGMDRDDRNALLGLHFFADRLHVVADQADDAGGIDEGGLGRIGLDQLRQGGVELFLTAVDDLFLPEVRGEAQPVEFRSGRKRTADVPGIGRASHRAVDQMEGVGYGIEDHAGAAKDTGPLAHGTGQTRLFTGNGSVFFLCPFLEDLFFPSLRISIIVNLA